METIKQLLLFLIAVTLVCMFIIPNLIYTIIKGAIGHRVKDWWKEIGDYFYTLAYSLDTFANVLCESAMNTVLIKNDTIFISHSSGNIIKVDLRFGELNETISKVLGRNKHYENLSLYGIFLANLLNYIDKNHVEDAFNKK